MPSHHQLDDKHEIPVYGRPRASSTPKIPKRILPNDHTSRRHSLHGDKRQEHHNNKPIQSPPLQSKNIEIDLLADSTSSDNQPSYVQRNCTPKIQSSFILCCGFLCFGSSMAIIGPTVLELGCLTGEDVGAMSWVFFAQTFSALLGAIFSGIITDRFNINYNTFLAVVMTLHSVSLCALPYMRTLSTLVVITSLHGLFAGFQDTATNLRMIIMHGQDVPPYLQTLFFFYGVGAFLSPIIAGNFLNDECNKGQMEDLGDEFVFSRRRRFNTAGVGFWVKQQVKEMSTKLQQQSTNTSLADQSSTEGNSLDIIHISTTRIQYAYFIIALLHVIVTIGLIYLHFTEKRRKEELNLTSALNQTTESIEETASRSERSEIDPNIRSQVLLISFWIAVMVFISDGLQGSFGSYIYTYAIKSNIGIITDDAAYLNSLFWGALALGRLLAIFVSMYVSSRIMLLADVLGCLLSIILMFLFRYHVISLWIGTATFGLCLSNIFPTSVSMAESYFRLTGTITCFFVVCSGIGEMAIPLLIGKMFDMIGPVTFLAISCILCFTSIGIYIAVVITGKGISRRLEQIQQTVTNTTEIEISPQQIEESKEINEEKQEKQPTHILNGAASKDIPPIEKGVETSKCVQDKKKTKQTAIDTEFETYGKR